MIPPTMRIGAETMIVMAMKMTCWTCWTSLVLRVISDAGAEVVDLDLAERLDLREDRPAHIAPEAHRDPRAEVDRDDRRDADDGRHEEHQAADAEDVVGVALDDAVVDDVALEVGQVEVADRPDEEERRGRSRDPSHRAEYVRSSPINAPPPAPAPPPRSHRQLRDDRLAGGPDGPEAAKRNAWRSSSSSREQPGEMLPTLLHHVTEDREPVSVGIDQDDAAVLVVVLALDQAALLHPADDPGRARDGDIERVGETRHRQGAAHLEDGQDVEVDQAQ